MQTDGKAGFFSRIFRALFSPEHLHKAGHNDLSRWAQPDGSLGPRPAPPGSMIPKNMSKWYGTQQRNDLKRCPFCGTAAVLQCRLAENSVNMQYRVGCGNPFCSVEPNTPPYASLQDAVEAWNERALSKDEQVRS